jgi:hypothetical protein
MTGSFVRRHGLVPLGGAHYEREAVLAGEQADHDLRLQAALLGEARLAEHVAPAGGPSATTQSLAARTAPGGRAQIELQLPGCQPLPGGGLRRLEFGVIVRQADVLNPARSAAASMPPRACGRHITAQNAVGSRYHGEATPLSAISIGASGNSQHVPQRCLSTLRIRDNAGRHRHAAQQTPSAAANHAPQASVSYPAPSQSRHRPYILCGTIWMTPRQVTIDDRSTLPQGCPTAGEDR